MRKINLKLKIDKDKFKKKLDIRDGVTPVKGVDYFDGEDADTEGLVEEVLSKIPTPEETTGEVIVDRINELGTDDELKIDASHIKNLDSFAPNGGGWRNLYQLHDVNTEGATNGQVIKYDSDTKTWILSTDSTTTTWGSITGTLSDQTDLQTALDLKASKVFAIAMSIAL